MKSPRLAEATDRLEKILGENFSVNMSRWFTHVQYVPSESTPRVVRVRVNHLEELDLRRRVPDENLNRVAIQAIELFQTQATEGRFYDQTSRDLAQDAADTLKGRIFSELAQ